MGLTLRLISGSTMLEKTKIDAIDQNTDFISTERLDNQVVATFPLVRSAETHKVIECGNNYG